MNDHKLSSISSETPDALRVGHHQLTVLPPGGPSQKLRVDKRYDSIDEDKAISLSRIQFRFMRIITFFQPIEVDDLHTVAGLLTVAEGNNQLGSR